MAEQEILQLLRKPFPKDKHLSNYDGFIYVDETAVSERLDEVDPGWGFQIISISSRDRKVVVHARMTILGVSRDGVGMTTVEYVKEKDDKGKVIGETDIEISEPEKASATDALRRCARLFGIGRYLLGAPKAKGAKQWESAGAWSAFNKWYDQQFLVNQTFEWGPSAVELLLAEAKKQGWSKDSVKLALGLRKSWDELNGRFPTYDDAWRTIVDYLADPGAVSEIKF